MMPWGIGQNPLPRRRQRRKGTAGAAEGACPEASGRTRRGASAATSRPGGLPGRKTERPGLVIELPFARGQLRVDLADPALPVGLLPGDPVPPEGVDIHDGERRILLPGYLDLHRVPPVVDQVVRIEETLPVLPPPLAVEPAHHEDPVDGIVGIRGGRKGPGHVRMDDGQKEVRILRVPPPGFQVHQGLDLFGDCGAQGFSPFSEMMRQAALADEHTAPQPPCQLPGFPGITGPHAKVILQPLVKIFWARDAPPKPMLSP